MADKSVPQLTALTGLTSTDLFHVVRSNIDYSTTFTELITSLTSNLNFSYRSTSIAATFVSTDYTIDALTGTYAITLLTAVGISGKIFNIKNSGTGIITINTTSSQTIDGNASGVLTLNQYDCITVQSNGANWIIL